MMKVGEFVEVVRNISYAQGRAEAVKRVIPAMTPTAVRCSRCKEPRWPMSRREPYVCHRCLEAQAGGKAIDPLPSPAQQAARKAAGERLQALPAQVEAEERPQTDLLLAKGGVDEALPVYKACARHRSYWRASCSRCNPAAPKEEMAADSKEWRSLRAKVMKRDKKRCKHCGTRSKLTVHHVTPRPLGTNDPRNLVTLCSDCHDAVEIPAETGAV